MKFLVVASNYPSAAHQFSGLFNERCVTALTEYCEKIEVLVPRPYVPPFLSLLPTVPRWQAYTNITNYELRHGVPVYRPACLQIPRVGSAFWLDQGAFLRCRRVVHAMHKRVGFDAIVSFDLVAAGGLAWRLARDLEIPASGWATGDDVRQRVGTPLASVVSRALEHLHLVFYQSRELLEQADRVLSLRADYLPTNRHVVLSRGIPEPPPLPRMETRHRMRSTLGITDKQVLVLSIGRIVQEKGVNELLHAISLATVKDTRITCMLVGSKPGFDQTLIIQQKVASSPQLQQYVRILPACSPSQVWEYLCAADIFAFPSHAEGMPNALLEAMAMGVPAVTFAIPPIREIDAGTEALIMVSPFDSFALSDALLHLAASQEVRTRIGEQGRAQVINRFMVRNNMEKAVQLLTQMIENHRPLSYNKLLSN